MRWFASLFRKPRPALDLREWAASTDAKLAARKARRLALSEPARRGAVTKDSLRYRRDRLINEQVPF